MSHSESETETETDAFSIFRNEQLTPSQPPSQLNTLSTLLFPTSQHNTSTLRLSLRVDASPGCGGIAWPAGEVLSRYIASRPRSTLEGKNVIELGSGTGLVGLVAAALGAKHVWITDQAPLLDIMRANVSLNGLAESTHVVEYDWGSPKPDALPARPDLILAADCVYFEPAFPLLVSTLCDLAPLPECALDHDSGSYPDTEILFCYKKRRKADKRFFTLLKKHFEWKQVDDDPEFPTYSREAIALLRLTRKR